jgi:hypothetical protein
MLFSRLSSLFPPIVPESISSADKHDEKKEEKQSAKKKYCAIIRIAQKIPSH